jgi:hypothetical protein
MLAARIGARLERYAAWFGRLIAMAIIVIPLVWMLLPADPHRRKTPRPRHANPAVQSLVSTPGEVALNEPGNAGR